MFTGPQVASLVLGMIMMICAVWGVVWTLQRSLKEDLHQALDAVSETVEEVKKSHTKNVDECRLQFGKIDDHFTKIASQIGELMQGDVRELKLRITRLEQGQDEWTKALRARTHDHSNEINTIKLKIDRLERPDRYHREPSDGT